MSVKPRFTANSPLRFMDGAGDLPALYTLYSFSEDLLLPSRPLFRNFFRPGTPWYLVGRIPRPAKKTAREEPR
jgi:hypothetical protein